MKIIGLTGPSGAGKGFCYNFFAKNDIPCIDTDDVYHKLLIPPSACVDELVANFGRCILDESNAINRKKLADIVFSDESRLQTLNKITHKYVLEKTHELIAEYKQQSKAAVVVDAPLLFEASFDEFCDFTIAVVANKTTRISRIIERDMLTYDAAVKRIEAQNSDEFYVSKATYTITNNKDADNLECQLQSVLNKEEISKKGAYNERFRIQKA